MNCKKCGTPLKTEDKICSNCGEPVDSSSNSDSSIIKSENKKKENNNKSNNALIAILVFLLLIICGFLVYAIIVKYNNANEPITSDNLDNDLDNNVDNNQNNEQVNYVLNDKLANVYEPITNTEIKIEDSNNLIPTIIMEIDENKNVVYYFEDCGLNCETIAININGEHAKYITYVSQGYDALFVYVILTEEGNIYTGNINNTIVEDATKMEIDENFVNITYGGNRVEQSGNARSILGVTSNNDYYNIIYCSNTKSGSYLTYSYYSDISDPNNIKNEYVLIYNDGSLSYLSVSSSLDTQLCDNYDYNQYIVNSNNEQIRAQVVLYNDGFYILGIDGYLYKLTTTNGNDYVADLYSSKKVKSYSYDQSSAYIRSIKFEYNDNTEETIENTYGDVQIVMVEEK